MTGLETATPIALRVGVAIVQRVAPSGLSLVKSWLRGKEILVIGQARAAKTTFVEYLHYGLFEDEKETKKTQDTELTPRFNVKLGRDSALEMTVKAAVDIPGQWGPVKHADVAFDRNPHVIAVILDSTSKGNNEADPGYWLEEFCRRFENQWRTSNPRKCKLKCLAILLNKSDRTHAEQIAAMKRDLHKVTDATLHQARGKMKDDVDIIACCAVTNQDGTKQIDSAIALIAKKLAK